jgi:exopolyphosphatase/guanosine-5'-triphosphate,3'-diphosphate pyrophosphatase
VAVANVARYHRGPTPRKKHDEFTKLDRELRRRIVRLAALLRVADGLDRGHAGAVDHVTVRWAKGHCALAPVPVPEAGSLRLELWGASRKADLLAEVLDAPVDLVAPDGATVVAAADGERT